MQIPRRKSDELRKRDDGPFHITQEGLKRLHERLVMLKASLPKLITETRQAADLGDRSENDEYKTNKAALRNTHRQILSTQDQIKRAVIIEPGPGKSGKVRLGTTVVLESGGKQSTFQIVGPYETDPTKGRISDQSPLGAALMNHAKGDSVTIHPPTGGGKGSKEYRIIEIR